MSDPASEQRRNDKAEAARRNMHEKTGEGRAGLAAPAARMPAGCPIIPIAATGTHVILMDSARHLLRLKNADVPKESEQTSLCGRNLAWLSKTYPKIARGGQRTPGVAPPTVPEEWNNKAFGRDLMVVAAERSGFPPEQERGTGAYAGRGGDLILHCGGQLYVAGQMKPLGVHDGYAYPVSEEALPRPWRHRVETGPDGPGARLVAYLGQWNYRRQIDPVLIVGWLAQAFIGGALHRRAGMIIAGEHGTGKTDIGDLLKGVLGRWCLASSDVTSAGLQQRLGRSRISVVLDEFEADDPSGRAAAMLTTMRIAHTGSETLRGTADHAPVGFTLHSAICALTTTPPAMTAADRSRQVIVRLVQHTLVTLRAMVPGEMGVIGQQLLRLMVDRWGWLQKTCLPGWRDLLLAAGFDHRDADVLGVVLACAWTVIYGEPPTEADFYRYEDDFVALLDEMRADRMPGWQRLLGHLFSKTVDAGRGMERRSVGQALRQAIGANYGVRQRDLFRDITEDMKAARQLLGQIGLKIELAEAGIPGIRAGAPVLLVANQCAALSELLRGSPWEGSAGRTTIWRDVLAQFPSAFVPRGPKRFVFGLQRTVALPLAELVTRMVGVEAVDETEVTDAG